MLTLDEMRSLVNAQPFVPFRLWTSDGGTLDIRHREMVLLGKRWAVIGLLDPGSTDTFFDRWTTIWYLHVTRVEMLEPGSAPFSAPSPSPS